MNNRVIITPYKQISQETKMSNLIQRKESARYPGFFVKKYTRKVFYDALWDTHADLMEARGHVEDADGNVVVRPFTKIFNRGEMGTDIDPNEEVLCIDKINGFMASATWIPALEQVVVSTTGSLDSDYIRCIECYVTHRVKSVIEFLTANEPATFLFEICHPDDPHIIREEHGAYLIGCRYVNSDAPYFSTVDKEMWLDTVARDMGVSRPKWKVCKFSEVVDGVTSCNHEGFVVYGQTSNTVLKIKSPHYLTLKAVARIKDISTLDKRRVDEEYFDLIDHLKQIAVQFNSMTEQERLEYVVNRILYR